MIKKFFNKFGITLTDQQSLLVKYALLFLLTLAITAFLATLFVYRESSLGQLKCISETNYTGYYVSHRTVNCNGSTKIGAPLWFFALEAVIFLIGFLPLLVQAVSYFFKIMFNKKFRETEMTHSVDYMETDEREQLLTMKATKRSYMVLNFALLIGWLFSLIVGKTNIALALFVIQAIGAISFRREMVSAKK